MSFSELSARVSEKIDALYVLKDETFGMEHAEKQGKIRVLMEEVLKIVEETAQAGIGCFYVVFGVTFLWFWFMFVFLMVGNSAREDVWYFKGKVLNADSKYSEQAEEFLSKSVLS